MNRLFRVATVGVALLFVEQSIVGVMSQQVTTAYFPSRDSWERKRPSEVGMDDAKLAEAIAFARDKSAGPPTFANQERINGRLLGPLPQTRALVNGLIIRHGYIVGEFGEIDRADPSYSMAKSYLSLLTGLAVDRGLIKSVADPVKNYVTDGGYDSPHNEPITWEQHLRQTTEWEGTLFGKPSTFVGAAEFGQVARAPRPLYEPGEFYEYNDVRVNRFSLSLLNVWKRPLPEVLKTEIMDPIGASNTWQYLGYDNSDVVIDGKTMKSVPGGTRWGGGLWMSALDHARVGLLMLRHGNWNGKQIISSSWITEATTPGGPIGADYGYLIYTNTKGINPSVSTTGYLFQGDGPNIMWVDPPRDLVVVYRWYGAGLAEFMDLIAHAIVDGPSPPKVPTETYNDVIVVRPGNGILVPKKTKSVRVVPPPDVPAHGRGIYSVLVGFDGKVIDVSVVSPLQPNEPRLEQAWVEAMKQSEFELTIIDQIVHPIRITIVVNFDGVTGR